MREERKERKRPDFLVNRKETKEQTNKQTNNTRTGETIMHINVNKTFSPFAR